MVMVTEQPNGDSSARLRWLSWTLWLVSTIVLAGSIVYALATGVADQALGEGALSKVSYATTVFTLVTVGAVVSANRGDHPIGWLLLGSGSLIALSTQLAMIAASTGSQIARWAALGEGVTWVPAFGSLVIFVPLLFPDGRVLSPRWRWALRVAITALTVETLGIVLRPGPFLNFPDLDNPLPVTVPLWLADVLGVLGPVLFGTAVLAAGVNVVIRYRRSRGIARQQFKWVAFPALLMLAYIPFNELVVNPLSDRYGFLVALSGILFYVAFGGLPVGIGIAVMRYRLYDIDRIIRRTLTYGLVAATLAAIFAGAVVVLTNMLPLQDDLAVAASTLAVAALFNPVRMRVKTAVDRRFNRGAYDAQREIDELVDRLRGELEPQEVAGEMLEVAVKTMQPARAGVWIRETGVAPLQR